MKKYTLFSLLIVTVLSVSACSQPKAPSEVVQNQTQSAENLSSTKTYKSNLYGFQFNYPAQYSSKEIKLDNVGMENISNGDELYGVQFDVPYKPGNPSIGYESRYMKFFLEVLTPNNANSEKIYSNEDTRKYADAAYQGFKKNTNFKTSDSLVEVSLSGEKAYQYKITETTHLVNQTEIHTFVSDGNTVYKIMLTDTPLMQEVLSSLKFKN